MNETQDIILVTNDDGIRSRGIEALARAAEALGEVWVVAPDRQQSAVSHSVSLHRPLRSDELRERWLMVDGTPVDCVMLAVRYLLPRRPSLVLSGVNDGANLGDDVIYSGTVAGAREGMLLRIPAIAVSNVDYQPVHLATAASVGVKLGEEVLRRGLPPDTMLNINVPDVPYEELGGIEHTRMGRRHYEDEITKREDPRGQRYFWIGGILPDEAAEPGTDVDAIERGCVSVTPLHRDLTNHRALEGFQKWPLSL